MMCAVKGSVQGHEGWLLVGQWKGSTSKGFPLDVEALPLLFIT